ncbi:class I SAM-dependent RNA methyltransferase [bacterium]|nr:class I SAM-dependent RNA methyltransferase [candidate division CSSED10-310 bacterium]
MNGSILEGRVAEIGFTGLGMVSAGGVKWWIPGVDIDESVRFAPVEDARGRRFGRLVEVMEPSPHRIVPVCGQADYCSGCVFQHLTYARSLRLKSDAVRISLQRNVGCNGVVVTDSPHHPEPLGYRLRAGFRVLSGPAGPTPSLRARNGWENVPDLRCCPVQSPRLNQVLGTLFRLSDVARLAAMCRSVQVGIADASTAYIHLQAETVLPMKLLDAAIGELPAEAALFVTSPAGRCLWTHGPAELGLSHAGRRLLVGPPAWMPVSLSSTRLLHDLLFRLLAPVEGASIIEIGAGVGTLTCSLTAAKAEVIAVDVNQSAVKFLEKNLGGASGVTIRLGEAHRAVSRCIKAGQRATIAILHAIRRPFGAPLARYLAPLGVERIIYIAPAVMTLVRDITALGAAGYRMQSIHLLDQLPYSYHLMVVAVLRRRS